MVYCFYNLIQTTFQMVVCKNVSVHHEMNAFVVRG